MCDMFDFVFLHSVKTSWAIEKNIITTTISNLKKKKKYHKNGELHIEWIEKKTRI